MRPDATRIDPHMKERIDNWVRYGLQPGSGTLAILENNLKEAVLRCDEATLENLPHIVAYIYGKCPAQCWGSPATVQAWRGLNAGDQEEVG